MCLCSCVVNFCGTLHMVLNWYFAPPNLCCCADLCAVCNTLSGVLHRVMCRHVHFKFSPAVFVDGIDGAPPYGRGRQPGNVRKAP